MSDADGQTPRSGSRDLSAALDRIGAAALAELPIDGAVVTLMSGSSGWAVAYATDPVVAELEEICFTLGEGPPHAAFVAHAPAIERDLARPRATGERWPHYAEAACRLGFPGVYSFPLQAGAVAVGTMTFYARHSDGLDDKLLARALALTDAAFFALLDASSPSAPPPRVSDDLFDLAGGSSFYRAEIYQASGMLMEQLGVPIADALVRLRAHAFVTDRPVHDVARDVVARRLRLDQPDAVGPEVEEDGGTQR